MVDDGEPPQKVRTQDRYKRIKSTKDGGSSKSELDKYLFGSEEDDNDSFDILGWWKINAPRFPTLPQIACDVLAIFVSMVASESAFSMGGCVLDPFRSSLTPKIAEALICSQNCL
uniref:HAT C-terminal dimerisation domain-containing protein n=1 Tax=Nelumbo nucifera TaxID=4432 RepID=A0A822XHQ7_NELNU|nr:TPA_asm: hypothetical protein HUJ06_020052 [Nelumbo nucifera]